MQKQPHKGRGQSEVANNYLRHVRMRLLASECETGINMWHPDDDQSAAADMTAKRRNGAPSGYASSMCEREGKGEGAGVWQRKVAMLCSLAF